MAQTSNEQKAWRRSKSVVLMSAILTLATLQACSAADNTDSTNAYASTAVPFSTVSSTGLTTSTSALTASVLSNSVPSGTTTQILVSGGVPPYTYSVAGGFDSTINSSSGIFTAGADVGSVTVTVEDSASNYTSAAVNVVTSASSTSTQITVSYSASSGFTLGPSQQIQLSGATLIYQSDGNLVLYSSSGIALWNSATAGYSCASNCSANWQGDGNLVLYANGSPYWSSGTSELGATLMVSSLAPYIAITNGGGVPVWFGN